MRDAPPPSMLSLHEPGIVRVLSTWLNVEELAKLRVFAARTRAAVQAVGCGACGARVADDAPGAIAVLVRINAGRAWCELACDIDLIRGLVDALTATRVGLMGTGRLSQVERSVLEFIIARLCSELAPTLGGCSVASISFGDADGPREAWDCTLRVDIGGRGGILRVRGVRALLANVALEGQVAIGPCTMPITAHVAMGTVALQAHELARVAPGECLLLPFSTISHVTNAGLETVQGWRLCDVRLGVAGDHVLCCEMAAWTPTPIAMPASVEPPAVRVLVGGVTFSPTDVLECATPRAIDVELGVQPNVTLCMADRIVGRGELVMVHGRVGVRVTEWRGT